VTRTDPSAATVQPYRLFRARVRSLRRLSPSFLRVTVGGDDLAGFADNGYDQHMKLLFPVPGRGLADLPDGLGWYEAWRALPGDRRPEMRTYTVRAARPAAREVDFDVVVHPEGPADGPAARWARSVAPGDELAMVGPDARYGGDHGGVDFQPPPRTGAVLLAGDETAVPAIAAILERLPAGTVGEVLLEVPLGDDALELAAPPGLRRSWLGRDGAARGSLLVPAVAAAARRLAPGSGAAGPPPTTATDDADDELWEVPLGPGGTPLAEAADLYAWLAGEAAVIRRLRRHLLDERGLDRRAVALMGYWRLGRVEDNG
jgi:NADPH-dependent ferric siderophore reductase